MKIFRGTKGSNDEYVNVIRNGLEVLELKEKGLKDYRLIVLSSNRKDYRMDNLYAPKEDIINSNSVTISGQILFDRKEYNLVSSSELQRLEKRTNIKAFVSRILSTLDDIELNVLQDYIHKTFGPKE